MDQFITILLPTYNRANIISDTINSVIKQTSEKWKLVIIDNGSEDETESICKEFVKRNNKIKYHRFEETVEVFYNYERSLEFVDTSYFVTFSDDDFMANTFIQEVINLINEDPDIILTNRFSYAPLDCNDTIIDAKLTFSELFPKKYSILNLSKESIWKPYFTGELIKEHNNLTLHPSMFVYSYEFVKSIKKKYGFFYKKGSHDWRAGSIAGLEANKILFINKPLVTIGGLFYSPYCFTFDKFKYFGMDFKKSLDNFDKSKLPLLIKILKIFNGYPYFTLNIIRQSISTLSEIKEVNLNHYNKVLNFLEENEILIVERLLRSISNNYLECLRFGDQNDNLIIALLNPKQIDYSRDRIKNILKPLFDKLFKNNRNYFFRIALSKFHNLVSKNLFWIPLKKKSSEDAIKRMNYYISKNFKNIKSR